MSRSHTPLGIPLRNISSPFPGTSSSNASTSSIAAPPSAVYCTLTPEETASKLQTSPLAGLRTSREANYRRTIHGPNELPESEKDPLWLRFIKQFYESALILLLLGSAVVSFLMKNYDDAISITIAVIIVVTVGFVQEYRSEKSLEALNKLVPHYAHLIRGKKAAADVAAGMSPAPDTVMAGQLVPGDLVSFSVGDRIPADLRITKASALEIDESNLTGENKPVRKTVAAMSPRDALNPTLSEIPVSERACIAYMGTLVRHGHGQGLTIATGPKTEFGTISAMISDIEKPRTPLQSSMDKLGKDLSYASFAVIGLIILVGVWQERSWLEMFQIGVSLAVAAIPEGLPIIVTVTLALGVLRMVKRGGIVRRLPSVETLGCVSVICSDKTGTLTMNHMTVTQLWTPEAPEPIDLTSIQDPTREQNTALKAIVKAGSMCNNAKASGASAAAAAVGAEEDSVSHSRFVGQPTDVALMDLMDVFGQQDRRDHFARSDEVPFSSERKWMGVVIDEEKKKSVYVKGALERILTLCDTYLTSDGQEHTMDQAHKKTALVAAEKMASEGLRVLGFARGSTGAPMPKRNNSGTSTPAPAEIESIYHGLTFCGAVGMYDPPRKDVQAAIRQLIRGRVKVMMITGDAETTAVAIARKLGMPLVPEHQGRNGSGNLVKPVLRGEEIDAMTDSQLAAAIKTTTVFARTSPEHKMKIIRALQAEPDSQVVAMTGDGVNDAPALKMADIGVAMGRHGTDVAKEAADMILSNDEFATILNAIEEGKGIFFNIQNFLTFQLSTSVAALSLVLLATFCGLKNPLNPMQILWINILMDGPPAQSLGVEPVDPIVMTRPPRSRTARILTRPVLQRVFTSATLIVLGTIAIYIREMAADGFVTARDTTMTFTCFVFFDMFNALTCRSESKSVLRGEVKLFGNKMFNFAVAGSLVGQMAVVYWEPLQRIFQTEALGLGDLGVLAALASTVLIADEMRKFVRRRRESAGGYAMSV